MSSVAPREPVWPRAPVRIDDLIGWAHKLTTELSTYFNALSAVHGSNTPRSGTPFIPSTTVVGVTGGSQLDLIPMIVQLTTTGTISSGTPVLLRKGQEGQIVILVNVSDFSIAIQSGSLLLTLAAKESIMIWWSALLVRWTRVS